ncbi:hypothetical protein [Achromobacter animicus]|uniref:hypothetical protein n=1 Tax=Achromobacter animicus TaxID=1389935 RepID=UPI0028B1FC29|nr:hypothetical protein [Achromobacter animicus]
MKQRNKRFLCQPPWGLALLLSAATCPTWAQDDPTKICATVPTIFTEKAISSHKSGATSLKKMLCSASWSSAQDAVTAGFDITVPIYDIPVPLSANFSREKQEAWQAKNCSAEERSNQFRAVGYTFVKEINPAVADAWLQCILTTHQAPRALSCKVTETETSAIFEVKWRPFDGTKIDEAPIVTSLSVQNTTCTNADALKPGTAIGSGGVAVLCAGNVDATPIMVLNTDRGSCLASGALATRVTTLSGTLLLSSPAVYRGDNLKLSSDLVIVTNGYDLTVDAKRLQIEGTPQIISFREAQKAESVRGQSAGKIHIRARSVSGDQLRIANFGQDGGKGAKGRTGGPGDQGSHATRRYLTGGGCTGGDEGKPGGKGKTGYKGDPGAPGGTGGDVVLEIEQGLMNGSIERVFVATKRPDRQANTIACDGTCGGLGGFGGDRGDGGPGGPGGQPAGGDWPCGGHPGGGPGPRGDDGTVGDEGPLGAPGAIKLL